MDDAGHEAVRVHEIADLESRLDDVRSRGRRHLLWALLGLSPTGLLLLPGVVVSGSAGLLATLVTGVVVVEGLRFHRARSDARAVEARMTALTAPSPEDPS